MCARYEPPLRFLFVDHDGALQDAVRSATTWPRLPFFQGVRYVNRSVSAVLLGLSLGACTTLTVDELRERPHSQSTFQVQQNYQRAYRTVLTNARKCWQQAVMTAQVVVTSDIYTDTRAGEISVGMQSATGNQTFFIIDIKAVDETKTEVRTLSGGRGWSPYEATVKEWLEIGHSDCKVRAT